MLLSHSVLGSTCGTASPIKAFKIALTGRKLCVAMRILIADDNVVFQNVLRAMLTQWGYDVVVADDGDEAWRRLQAEDAPRLAILDWMMPSLDGVEVCRRVRATRPITNTYIIILTAKMQSEDLATAVEAGADDYVTKPFKSVELRARLRTARRVLDLEGRLLPAGMPLAVSPVLTEGYGLSA
jgi:DNA-binding response OmpR family regulator